MAILMVILIVLNAIRFFLNIIYNYMLVDFVDLIQKNIKIIRVSLNQMCYIIPSIVILSKFFKIEFYFITDGVYVDNKSCLYEINKYGLVESNDANLYHMTLDEFSKQVVDDFFKYDSSIIYYTNSFDRVYNSNIVSKNIIKKISFRCSHGIDEEAYIYNKIHKENILDYVILSTISGISGNDYNMINNIYKIDKSKKTILFQDTTNTFFHKLDKKDITLQTYQDKMLDDLIKLKDKYNIIIRYHPQYYQSFISGYQSICDRIYENFIIDYTQLSLFDLYDISDIIISTRYTSSGYQALFKLNKNIIMIDMDLDSRKKALLHRCKFVTDVSNSDLINLMKKGMILNGNHVITEFENKISIYDEVSLIEKNDFIVNDKIIYERYNFIEQQFNISKTNINDKNDIYFFIIYIIVQTERGKYIIKNLFNIIADHVDSEKLEKVKIGLMQRFNDLII